MDAILGRISAAGTLLLAVACCGTAAAQAPAYPVKPVRMVIPFAPGGGTDIVGRIIGQKLTEAWTYPVVVDRRLHHRGSLDVARAERVALPQACVPST